MLVMLPTHVGSCASINMDANIKLGVYMPVCVCLMLSLLNSRWARSLEKSTGP